MSKTLAHRLMASFEGNAGRPAAFTSRGSASYGELAARAWGVAQALRDAGVGPGHRVGVWMEKSLDSLGVLLGCLFAGATCVPIDFRAPLKRSLLVASDGELSALAVDAARREKLPSLLEQLKQLRLVLVSADEPGRAAEAIAVDRASRAVPYLDLALLRAQDPSGLPPPHLRPEHPAYILYTSGSTGQPKGVVLSHRAVLSFVDWCTRTFQARAEDRMISHAPWHFDLSTFDLYVPFSIGGSVRLLTAVEAMHAPWIGANLSSWGITFWYSVPSALVALVEEAGLNEAMWPEARTILFAGEPFPVPKLARLRRALPRPRLFNLFGPTETNVCTYYEVKEVVGNELSLPIGRVCEHLNGLILNEQMTEVSPEEEGDLWIGGGNVFSGYWKDPDLTRRKLLADPRPGARGLIYNTGDRVRLQKDGNLCFLGRKDFMVKIRGYRVELGEVESALHAIPDLCEAAVVAVPYRDTHRLAAFICWSTEAGRDQSRLTTRLKERLPLYMVPDLYCEVSRLPRTSTGKVDRALLREEAVQKMSADDNQCAATGPGQDDDSSAPPARQ